MDKGFEKTHQLAPQCCQSRSKESRTKAIGEISKARQGRV